MYTSLSPTTVISLIIIKGQNCQTITHFRQEQSHQAATRTSSTNWRGRRTRQEIS